MRSRSTSLLLACTLVALHGFAGAVQAVVAPSTFAVVDGDDIVADHPQVEWAEAYLQWVASFPRGSSPVSDTSGALCDARQDGDVWFLAASDGTAAVERRCTVPAGKTLFVPIAAVTERSGNREPDCASMARIAADTLAQQVVKPAMSVDGQALFNLESHRIATGDCFALGLRQTPRVALKAAVADGYYVMLRPLAAGTHTVVTSPRADKAALATTYRLEVR